MQDATINKSSGKKCAFCKYWYDPANSAISPKAPQIGIWSFDERAVKKCLKSNLDKRASYACTKFESKMNI